MAVIPAVPQDKVLYDRTLIHARNDIIIRLYNGSVFEIWGDFFVNGNPIAEIGALPIASQAEAEAGVDNSKVMTPLRVSQAIDAHAYVDEVYGPGWNGDLQPPTKNAVYDKIETISAGSGLPAASNAETIAGTLTTKAVTPASLEYERPYVDVRTHGATGDGTTDDTVAIQSAVTATPIDGTVYFPSGVYKTSGTITSGQINVDMAQGGASYINYTGTGTAWLCTGVSSNHITLHIRRATLDWDDGSDTTSEGIVIRNSYGGRFTLIALNFAKGVVLRGDGVAGGVSYNEIDLITVWNCKTGLGFEQIAGGWTNQNSFRGRIAYGSGASSFTGTRSIDLSTGGNNNTFWGMSLEGANHDKTFVVAANFNMFVNCRFEANKAGALEFLAGSYANQILYGFDLLTPGDAKLIDAGTNTIYAASATTLVGNYSKGNLHLRTGSGSTTPNIACGVGPGTDTTRINIGPDKAVFYDTAGKETDSTPIIEINGGDRSIRFGWPANPGPATPSVGRIFTYNSGFLGITGHLAFSPNNTYDIGSSGVAPRDIRAGRNVIIGGALDHDGTTAGFYATTPITKPTSVTARTALEALGLGATLTTDNEGRTFSADISVPDEVYGAGWNGSFEVPTKNAVYDKIELASAGVVNVNGFTKTDVIAAMDAAELKGKGTIVRFAAGTYELGTGLSLSGYSCQLHGVGAAGTVAAPAGTIFKASTQSGPVLDFTNFAVPGEFLGRITHKGFHVIGSNAADATKNNSGIRLKQLSSTTFSDISIQKTGGPCIENDDVSGNATYLCDFERIILNTPISAKANDVPYMKLVGANGNRFRGFGLRSLLSSADVGVSGAVILTDDGTFAPHDNLFDGWWIEFLHVPTNGTIFAIQGNANIFNDFQWFDTTKESGATGTSHFRFTPVAASGVDFGGNLVKGIIPGKGTDAVNIDMGIDMQQSRNSVVGIKGYRGTNVVIASGVTNTNVDLGGAFAAAIDPAVVDNSGSLTQFVTDSLMRTERKGTYLVDERTAAQGGVGLRVQDPATPANGALWMGTSSTRIQAVGAGMFLTGDVVTIRNVALNGPPTISIGASTTIAQIRVGTGTPEGTVTSPIGSIYLRVDGSASTTLYVKESGTGNTGWVAYGPPGGGGISDGDKGDITVSSSGTVWNIDASAVGTTEIADDAVTYAKIQNVSATDKLLGRSTAGAGDIEEITCTAAGRALLDDADAAAQRTTLGLVIGTNVQAFDGDLNTIAGLTATTDNIIQSVSGAWASRTPAQVKTALALNNVDNTSDANKPVSTATQTALDLKEDKAQTINAQTGTTYTFVLADQSKFVSLSNASAITLTVPPNSSVAFPVGTRIDICQIAAGQVTVAPGSGVTLNGTPGLKTRAQWSGATLIKRATDTWTLFGDLAA